MRKTRSLLMLFVLLLASLACNFFLAPDTTTPTPGPAPTAAQSADISGADITYYDIRGSSANELRLFGIYRENPYTEHTDLTEMYGKSILNNDFSVLLRVFRVFRVRKMPITEILGEPELRGQMDWLGPLDDGRRWDAYTAWSIRWNWPGHGTRNCDLSRATTSLEITVTLPRWANPGGADATLIKRWNNYYEALAHHEQGHVDNVTQGYPKVLQAIQSATCATAEQAALQAVELIHAADRDYDKKTSHGASEGARFP